MQAYMRSAMPFHGVPAPVLRAVCRPLFDGIGFDSAADWERAVRYLWERARFREERYAAIALSGVRAARRFQTPRAIPLYEDLIVDGAWWDYVDDLAIRRVGPILRSDPAPVSATMLRWSRSDDLWKRRSSIICQVGSKAVTDFELLSACIEPSLAAPEFFLRKAIGWALRQYARTAPDTVRRYVREQRDRLSPLSLREATRHLAQAPDPRTGQPVRGRSARVPD